MPGIRLVTNLGPQQVMEVAQKAAKRLQFTVIPQGDGELIAQKGSMVASIFLGAFIAYCDFRIFVDQLKNQSVEITLERNNPWWTGLIGIERVKSRAKELADELEDAIHDRGGEVMSRDNF
jgi:hypothetical protein